MNTGNECIEWLYSEQLKVDDEWAIRTPNGFKWWADKNAQAALSLNTTELAEKPSGYGFGSYSYRDGSVHFTSFLPNAAYRAGLLPNLYFASGQRARVMSIRLTNRDWNAKSFSPRRSAMGRLLSRIRDR